MKIKDALRSKVFVIKLALYSLVVLVAVGIDYREVVVLESGIYAEFSIFDFFFYKPFNYFFQWTQLGVLILIHHLFGRKMLKRIEMNILMSTIEVAVSSVVFLAIAMISHTCWGGRL